MRDPAPVAQLLEKKAGNAVIGDGQRYVRRISDRCVRQVLLGPGKTAVGRAAHMQGVDVCFVPPVGPTYVDGGTIIGIHGDRKCRADAFLPQRRSMRPRDGSVLNYDAAR